MKKWVILILVILGGLLLALQYLMNKKAGPGLPAANTPVDSNGVPLPAGATNYLANIPYAPPINDLSDPSKLNIPMIPTTYKGACEGGALTDMIGTHNKYWGRLAKDNPFSPNDTRRMYAFVGDYVGCVAVARDNATLCDTLPPDPPQKGTPRLGARADSPQPAPPDRGNLKVRSEGGLRFNCRKRVNPILFIAFMAGKSKSSDSCSAILSGWKPPTLAKISITDFCAAAEKGIDAVTEYMQKTIVKKKKKDSKKPARSGTRFASSESACGGNKECIASAKLYNAIRSGNAAQCPPAKQREQPTDREGGRQGGLPAPPERPSGEKDSSDVMCTAAISRSPMSCEPIIKAMSGFYCAAVVKAKKKGGGYMGMTKAEVDAAVAQKKNEAEETERRRKEAQKEEAEINKKVKKLLGKE